MSRFNYHGRRKFPAGLIAAPRKEAEKVALEVDYYDVPDVPAQPTRRVTISDLDMRKQRADEHAELMRRKPEEPCRLRYVPANGGRPVRVVPVRAEQPAPQPVRTIPEVESTAAHESAHVCLAAVTRCTNVEATIEPSREDGVLRYGHTAYTPPANLSLVHNLAISTAGGVWEMMEYGRYIAGPDGNAVNRKLDEAGVSDPDKRAAVIAEAHAYARFVLEANREMVRELTKRLIEEGTYKHPTTQVRRVTLPLQTRSGAASFDAAAGTIQVVWGTGARVKRSSYDGVYWEDLPARNADLTWMNSGKCPLLDSHNSARVSDVLGVVQAGSAFVRDGKGYATIKISGLAPIADIKAGTLRNISIGYVINRMKELPAGDDGIPVMRVESYTIKEASIVGVPADEGAEIRKFECEWVTA